MKRTRSAAAVEAGGSGPAAAGRREVALLARVRAVARALALPTAEAEDGSQLAADLAEHVRTHRRRDEAWLLLVALGGTFPTPDQVDDAVRTLRLAHSADVLHALLSAVRRASTTDLCREVEIVGDLPVVDVDFTARHDLHTGIQRVVRETLPRWQGRQVRLVAWNGERRGYRALDSSERDRVLRFRRGARREDTRRLEDVPAPLVVPWRTALVLPEVPSPDVTDRLSALAAANKVVLVGYDCIPVVSADVLPPEEPVKFVRYLSLVKRAHAVAAISEAAAEEFRGFRDMLPTQGLQGPRVLTCALPAQSAPTAPAPAPARTPDPVGGPTEEPYVLVVGSQDPRKNHLAVLHAAERSWLAGRRFRLVFAGSRGWRADDFDREVSRLRRAGRTVQVLRSVDDELLWRLYRGARFSVFPSVHEGYGLPVAESLAVGVPCITSRFGSMGEIAAGGGALTVDPFDDDDLHRAMAQLLDDDALHGRLVEQARNRRDRTWQQYADELWDVVQEEVG